MSLHFPGGSLVSGSAPDRIASMNRSDRVTPLSRPMWTGRPACVGLDGTVSFADRQVDANVAAFRDADHFRGR